MSINCAFRDPCQKPHQSEHLFVCFLAQEKFELEKAHQEGKIQNQTLSTPD